MTARRVAPLLLLAALAACQKTATPPPRPTPRPASPLAAPGAIRYPETWNRRVSVIREDSIIISAGDGSRQIERRGRTAVFLVTITDGSALRITLDSLGYRPAAPVAAGTIGTTWSGRLAAPGKPATLNPGRRSPQIDDLLATVEQILPALPSNGVTPGMTWRDTSEVAIRVDAFDVTEMRTSAWRVGDRMARGPLQLVPLTLREGYEQVGSGKQAGRDMTMTAQGVRTGAWYFTLLGEIESATLTDSSANLVTIRGTRQAIPAIEMQRTTIRYTPR